jgi:hypothetical protein
VARNTTRQGASFELAAMHFLAGCQGGERPCKDPQHALYEGHEYTCLRSSGSRGAVDVVAVGQAPTEWERKAYGAGPDLLFIQCKITNPVIPPAERMALQDLALRAGAVPLVAFKALDRVTGRITIKFRRLTGPGPKDWAPWAPGEDD